MNLFDRRTTYLLISVVMIAWLGALYASLTGLLEPRELRLIVGGFWIAQGYYFRFISPKADHCPPAVTSTLAVVGLLIILTASRVVIGGVAGYWLEVAATLGLGWVCFVVWFITARYLDDLPVDADAAMQTAKLFRK